MLLGIALHGGLAYASEVADHWVVPDSDRSMILTVASGFIHGFRMPVFFVLSGFFTAMLWQKRGLRGLLRHRAKRVFLPLAVGCLTIAPAVWAVAAWTGSGNATYGLPDMGKTVWQGTADGDLEKVRRFIDVGWPLDERDPILQQTPMAWAINHDRPEVVAELLEAGADPNGKFGDQGLDTHLHAVALFGRSDCARMLLDAGADTEALDALGNTPWEALIAQPNTWLQSGLGLSLGMPSATPFKAAS